MSEVTEETSLYPLRLRVPAPALYAITDNGVVTTDTHRTFGEASTRLDVLNQRYPNHGHSIVALYTTAA